MNLPQSVNRREFLYTAAGTAAGLYLGGCSMSSRPFADLPSGAMGPAPKGDWPQLAQLALSRVKAGECFAEVLTLVQNRAPRQTGLERLQNEEFKNLSVVADRPAPFFIVIGFHQRIQKPGPPRAAFPAVRFHEISMILFREVQPDTMRTRNGATPRCSASARTIAALARPWTGGSVTATSY